MKKLLPILAVVLALPSLSAKESKPQPKPPERQVESDQLSSDEQFLADLKLIESSFVDPKDHIAETYLELLKSDELIAKNISLFWLTKSEVFLVNYAESMRQKAISAVEKNRDALPSSLASYRESIREARLCYYVDHLQEIFSMVRLKRDAAKAKHEERAKMIDSALHPEAK